MGYVADGRPFRWFALSEVANTQADEEVKVVFTPELIRHGNMMDQLRDFYGKPMNVNSWYRTLTFNKKVGGSPNSCHLLGNACDIALPSIDAATRNNLIAAWRMLCQSNEVIGGVGIYKWGLHFDSNDDPLRYGTFNNKFRLQDYR